MQLLWFACLRYRESALIISSFYLAMNRVISRFNPLSPFRKIRIIENSIVGEDYDDG